MLTLCVGACRATACQPTTRAAHPHRTHTHTPLTAHGLLDNDGAPFQWTPNVQLISKVYLKKHTSQPRTYSLNKKDAEMVKDAVAKKL